MNEILNYLVEYGGVMLSSTANGWCCHVINAKAGINRHIHANTAEEVVNIALEAMRRGEWLDEVPEVDEIITHNGERFKKVFDNNTKSCQGCCFYDIGCKEPFDGKHGWCYRKPTFHWEVCDEKPEVDE